MRGCGGFWINSNLPEILLIIAEQLQTVRHCRRTRSLQGGLIIYSKQPVSPAGSAIPVTDIRKSKKISSAKGGKAPPAQEKSHFSFHGMKSTTCLSSP